MTTAIGPFAYRKAVWRNYRPHRADDGTPLPPPPGRAWRNPTAELACETCGIAVPGHPDSFTTRTVSYELSPGVGGIDRDGNEILIHRSATARFGRCVPCATLHEQARLRARDTVGTDENDILRALVVCRIAGVRPPTDTHELTRWFIPGAAGVIWADLICADDLDLVTRTSMSEPWGWCRSSAAPWARRQEAVRLKLRATPGPLVVKPPRDCLPGCGYCGLDRVEIPRSQAHDFPDPWTRLHSSEGGRKVALCPTCSSVSKQIGSHGPTAAETALVRHLFPGKSGTFVALGGYFPTDLRWSARRGRRPNRTPWGHLDLDSVKDNLAIEFGWS